MRVYWVAPLAAVVAAGWSDTGGDISGSRLLGLVLTGSILGSTWQLVGRRDVVDRLAAAACSFLALGLVAGLMGLTSRYEVRSGFLVMGGAIVSGLVVAEIALRVRANRSLTDVSDT